MKTLLVLSMALAVSQASFVAPNRDFSPRFSGKFGEHSRQRSEHDPEALFQRLDAMTVDEREADFNKHKEHFEAMENFPARSHSRPEMDFQKFEEIHQRLKAMTPEERKEEFLNKRRRHFEKLSPRPAHHAGFDVQKFEEILQRFDAMTPEEREAKYNEDKQKFEAIHGRPLHHPQIDVEKMKEIRQRFESMTPEERKEEFLKLRRNYKQESVPAQEEIKHRSPRSVRPAQHEISEEMRQRWEAMTPEEREQIINERRKHTGERPPHRHESNNQRFEDSRRRWEAMTPEEREEAKNGRRKQH